MNTQHICKAPYQAQAGNGDLKVALLVFVCTFTFLSEISRLSGSDKFTKHKENTIHASLLHSRALIVSPHRDYSLSSSYSH